MMPYEFVIRDWSSVGVDADDKNRWAACSFVQNHHRHDGAVPSMALAMHGDSHEPSHLFQM